MESMINLDGASLVFPTSFGYFDPHMLAMCAKFPNVQFRHCGGMWNKDKHPMNAGSYFGYIGMGQYLNGITAGHATKSKKIGFVAAKPIPQVLRNINAFTLGAQSVNPKIRTKVVWVNTWYDPGKESEAAQSLINQKADVLLQNTDSTAVLETAEKNGKYAFGWDSDMSSFGPKAHLGSAIVNWAPYYIKAIEEVKAGTWKTERTVWGVKEGLNDLIKIADVVPEDAKKRVDEIKAGLKDGSFNPFTGPVVDNTGKERLAKDLKADQAWLDKVDFYVKGVEGKVPAGK
jgi:simple sugar transport system substrate-binding protein